MMKSRYRNIAMAVAAAWFGVAMTSVQARGAEQPPSSRKGTSRAGQTARDGRRTESDIRQGLPKFSGHRARWPGRQA